MAGKTKVAESESASQNSETATKPEADKISPKGKESVLEKENRVSPKKDDKLEKKGKQKNPFSFTDPLQCKLVNCIMKNGKKTVAQQILRDTFDELFRIGERDPLKTFEVALQKATPAMEVRAKRIGGAVYQIPVDVPQKRQQSLAIRWILDAARSRKGRPMYQRLAQELVDAANDAGQAVNKKKEAHRMAQSNKAFAHLAKY